MLENGMVIGAAAARDAAYEDAIRRADDEFDRLVTSFESFATAMSEDVFPDYWPEHAMRQAFSDRPMSERQSRKHLRMTNVLRAMFALLDARMSEHRMREVVKSLRQSLEAALSELADERAAD